MAIWLFQLTTLKKVVSWNIIVHNCKQSTFDFFPTKGGVREQKTIPHLFTKGADLSFYRMKFCG